MERDLSGVVEQIVTWIQRKVREAGARGTIVALSGGIDAAVTSALCQRAFPEANLGVTLPCHSDPQDEADARLFAEHVGVSFARVDLTPVYDALVAQLKAVDAEVDSAATAPDLALANIKPRLRMTTLYYLAARHDYLVVGTENLSELTIGYFTKYGDGGVDLLPIAGLVKEQVYELAAFLDVPEAILRRVPGAGLWAGQTDEAEMGVSYDVLDAYILTGEGPAAAVEKIEHMRRTSEHKRERPPIAPVHWPSS